MSATFSIPNPPNAPIKLGTFAGSVRMTVLTAGTGVRIAKDRTTLETPPPFAGISGMLILDTDRQIQEGWNGEMWALGTPSNMVTPFMELDDDKPSPVNP